MNKYCILVIGIVAIVIVSGCSNSQQGGQQQQQGQIPGKSGSGLPGFDTQVGMPGNIDNANKDKSSNIGKLKERSLDGGKVKMLIPDDWNTKVFPGCIGLVTADGSNAARSVIFMNGLHQSIDPLPPGVSPEDYVKTYMQNDFKTISNVEIIKYEDTDLSALRIGGANVQAMRVSFKNNGVPAIGSFTVNTYGSSISSAVGYIWGITSTADEFEIDGATLLSMFKSIKYDDNVIEECRKLQKESWGIKE